MIRWTGIPWTLVLGLAAVAGGAAADRTDRPAAPSPAPCPDTPNCVSSLARDADHRVEPLTAEGDAASVMAALERAVLALPRTRIVERTETYLRSECRSRIFRFVDDLELWYDVPAGVVHVRSASRTGYSDLGANRRRVERLRSLLGESR